MCRGRTAPAAGFLWAGCGGEPPRPWACPSGLPPLRGGPRGDQQKPGSRRHGAEQAPSLRPPVLSGPHKSSSMSLTIRTNPKLQVEKAF